MDARLASKGYGSREVCAGILREKIMYNKLMYMQNDNNKIMISPSADLNFIVYDIMIKL